MPKYGKPKPKPVITRKVANMIQENANNSRKGGTPNDMIIAKASEDFKNNCTIIDEN